MTNPEEEAPEDPISEHSAETPRQTTVDPDETPNLAQAILLLTKEFSNRDKPKKAKAKEPDTFDGSDFRKLNNFVFLCNLYFRNNSAYDEDSAKVTFALSYLRGTALEYFEPSILDSDGILDWIDSWSAERMVTQSNLKEMNMPCKTQRIYTTHTHTTSKSTQVTKFVYSKEGSPRKYDQIQMIFNAQNNTMHDNNTIT